MVCLPRADVPSAPRRGRGLAARFLALRCSRTAPIPMPSTPRPKGRGRAARPHPSRRRARHRPSLGHPLAGRDVSDTLSPTVGSGDLPTVTARQTCPPLRPVSRGGRPSSPRSAASVAAAARLFTPPSVSTRTSVDLAELACVHVPSVAPGVGQLSPHALIGECVADRHPAGRKDASGSGRRATRLVSLATTPTLS